MLIPPRWEKVLTDLWGNITRSLLTVSSIAVGLFAIGIIATVYVVVKHDIYSSYRAVNPTNINIQTSLVDDDVLQHIRHIEGVKQVEGIRSLNLRIKNSKGEWQSIELKAYGEMQTTDINKLRLREGRWPKEGEIVIDVNKAIDLKEKNGDYITLELPSGKTRAFHLVGIVQDQTIGAYGNPGGFFNAPIQGYVHRDSLEKLEQVQTGLYNTLYVTVMDGRGDDLDYIRRISERIDHDLRQNAISMISSKPASSSNHPNASVAEAIISILVILGFLSVFLSGFLVTNTLQALLKQQTQQIGIMKSVGARQNQIIGVYLALILTFGILAFLLATPLAYFSAFRLLDFVANRLNFVLEGQRLEFTVVTLQASLAVLMPIIASWQPIRVSSRISVIEALNGGIQRNKGKQTKNTHQSKKSSPFDKISGLALPRIIAIRNTFRQKGRLILTLITLSLGGSIFIATFNVRVSLENYITQIKQYFTADVNLVLKRPYRVNQMTQILDAIPGIGYYEAWTSTQGRMIRTDGSTGDLVQLLAPPATSRVIKPILLKGRWIRDDDRNTIVLSDAFNVQYPSLDVGSTLRMKIDDRHTDWKVIGFFQLSGRISGLTAYATYGYVTELTCTPGKATIFQITGEGKVLTPAGQEILKNAVEHDLVDQDIAIYSLTTGNDDSSSRSGGLNTLTVFLMIMAILIALVGSIGLAGTMSMNVLERTREFGILRSIGASDHTLMDMVLTEGLTIGMISYLIGALGSFPITSLLGDSVIMAIFGTHAKPALTPTGFLLWLALVIVLSIAASLIPARNAAQLTIREVLAYE